jgi:hypothetical protein
LRWLWLCGRWLRGEEGRGHERCPRKPAYKAPGLPQTAQRLEASPSMPALKLSRLRVGERPPAELRRH